MEKSLIYRIIRSYFDRIPSKTNLDKVVNEDEARQLLKIAKRLTSENGICHITGGQYAEMVIDFESEFNCKYIEPVELKETDQKHADVLMCHFEYCNSLNDYSNEKTA